ncbi:MAG TPA: hypothetical protein VF668_01175 [Pyrinomonadaceae bacterium]|jgi:hypothetical protein
MGIRTQSPLGARRPRGRALAWTPNECAEMAAPTREQREASRARLEEESPSLSALLDAEPDERPEEA